MRFLMIDEIVQISKGQVRRAEVLMIFYSRELSHRTFYAASIKGSVFDYVFTSMKYMIVLRKHQVHMTANFYQL